MESGMGEWSMTSRLSNWRGVEGGGGGRGGNEGGPPTIQDYARALAHHGALLPSNPYAMGLGPYPGHPHEQRQQPPAQYAPLTFGAEYERFGRGGGGLGGGRPRLGSFPQRRTLIDTFVQRDDVYWQTRLTLKIDVPFTDHSHIIGRQGKNTQKVMKDTQCHIHFPDSNKNMECEKSNQVSIAGPPGMVEEARARIRSLAPLTVTFELKQMRSDVDLSSLVNHPALETAVATEDLHVLVRHNRSSRQPFALIRGSVHQQHIIKQAVLNLMSLVFLPGQQVLCATSLEILQPQQDAVKGPANSQIQLISKLTGAAIHFPDISRPGAHTFFIQGTLEAILSAREHIVGCLPVHMMFELDMEQPGRGLDLPALEAQHRCSLSIRNKKSGEAKTAVISTLESYLSEAYAFRRLLLSSGNPHGPKAAALAREPVVECHDYDFMKNMVYPSLLPPAFPPEMPPPLPIHPLNAPHPAMPPAHFPAPQGYPYHLLSQPMMPGIAQQTVPHQPPMHFRPQGQMVAPLTTNFGASESLDNGSLGHPPTLLSNSAGNSTGDALGPPAVPLVNVGPCDLPGPVGTPRDGPASPLRAPHPTPVAADYPLTPRANLEQQLLAADLAGSEDGVSPLGTPAPQRSSAMTKAPGSGRRLRFADYDVAQQEAQKAFAAAPSGVRVPVDIYSGLYLSKTMNEAKLRSALASKGPVPTEHTLPGQPGLHDAESTGDETSGGSGSAHLPTMSPSLSESPTPVKGHGRFAETTHLDGALGRAAGGLDTATVARALAATPSVPELLALVGLPKFSELFQDEDVTDIPTFLGMGEDDFRDIGVATFGHRKALASLQAILRRLTNEH